MKKNIFKAAVVAAALSLSGCTTLGLGSTSGSTNSGTDIVSAGAAILENLLGGLLSNTLTEQSFVGSWTYQEPQVRFESENLLTKAGGAVVAQSLEKNLDKYLSKVGISKGVTTYTFNDDKTFTITTKGRTISSGTYSYDRTNKILNLNGTLGIMNQSCTVGIIMIRTYFQNSIPDELYEASQLDGCSDFNYMIKVLLPLSGPIVAVIALYTAVGIWNSYFNALIYLTKQELYPLQLFLRNILTLGKNINIDEVENIEEIQDMIGLSNLMKYAVIVVASVPVMVIYPFVQRFFVKGVVVGSIKG